MASLATTPAPPYYAVIFTSLRTADDNGYNAMAARMEKLAAQQPGFLGIDSARQDIGITVSYWSSLEAIKAWREHAEHRQAQQMANRWYQTYTVHICRVEHTYDMAQAGRA